MKGTWPFQDLPRPFSHHFAFESAPFLDFEPLRPEQTIVFGVPRVADQALDDWWRSRQLCRRLLRVNTYNDLVHVTRLSRHEDSSATLAFPISIVGGDTGGYLLQW